MTLALNQARRWSTTVTVAVCSAKVAVESGGIVRCPVKTVEPGTPASVCTSTLTGIELLPGGQGVLLHRVAADLRRRLDGEAAGHAQPRVRDRAADGEGDRCRRGVRRDRRHGRGEVDAREPGALRRRWHRHRHARGGLPGDADGRRGEGVDDRAHVGACLADDGRRTRAELCLGRQPPLVRAPDLVAVVGGERLGPRHDCRDERGEGRVGGSRDRDRGRVEEQPQLLEPRRGEQVRRVRQRSTCRRARGSPRACSCRRRCGSRGRRTGPRRSPAPAGSAAPSSRASGRTPSPSPRTAAPATSRRSGCGSRRAGSSLPRRARPSAPPARAGSPTRLGQRRQRRESERAGVEAVGEVPDRGRPGRLGPESCSATARNASGRVILPAARKRPSPSRTAASPARELARPRRSAKNPGLSPASSFACSPSTNGR